MTEILYAKNISKIYDAKVILKNIDWKISAGSLYLLTGVNGSGKSTLLKIIAGLSRPTKGTVIKDAGLATGYLGHDTFNYPGLTALENLHFWAGLNNKRLSGEELKQQLERVRLSRNANQRTGSFSRGMLQRLNFCRVLLQTPQLLLLDEPFTGLDHESRRIVTGELIKLKNDGAAIIMVTHDPRGDCEHSDYILEIRDQTLKPREQA